MTMPEDAALAAFHKLAAIAEQRSTLYWMFALGFSNPTSEFIVSLQSGELADSLQQNLEALGLNEVHLGMALHGLSDVAAQYRDEDPSTLLTQLRVEYMRLFIGPRDPVIPIYETYHQQKPNNGTKPLLFVSATAVAVERQYREAGVEMATRESPDHLVTELEFMVYLCSKEAQAWQEDNNAMAKKWRRLQNEFLEKHLGVWGKPFLHQVQEVTEEPFYRYFAALAETFLHLETGAFRPRG